MTDMCAQGCKQRPSEVHTTDTRHRGVQVCAIELSLSSNYSRVTKSLLPPLAVDTQLEVQVLERAQLLDELAAPGE